MFKGGGAIHGVRFIIAVACCALILLSPIAKAVELPGAESTDSNTATADIPAESPLEPISTWQSRSRSLGLQEAPSPNPQSLPDPPRPFGFVKQVAAESEPVLRGQPVLVPVERAPIAEGVQMQKDNGLVTLIATGAELTSVLRMIADHHSLNLVLAPDVGGPVTVSIRGAEMEEVLDAILGVAGFSWHRVGNLLYVTGASSPGMDPRVQGRMLRVYPLDYVAATDIEPVANGLLSPVGTAFVSEADSADQKKTREILVVEDTPAAHQRIEEYIAQIDIPPRQVLVEAHLLQIALDGEERHGVNLRALARVGGAKVIVEGTKLATEGSSGPSVALRIDGTDMTGIVELIRSQTNSRTLASPKLSVVNHQEAKIQIGQRLPYSVATTTQTSTIQSVEFLEVGVVLTVRPIITDDNHVLMTVLPKVSGGTITENGFPEEDTTEVSTTILLPDGGGVIIGGLIREENVDSNSIVPGLGRIPIVGILFRRRASECRRNELIVALVTHIMPDVHGPRVHEMQELENTLPPYAARELSEVMLSSPPQYGY